MKALALWALMALLALDCGLYFWGLQRWIRFLRAQRLEILDHTERAQVLATPEYRRLRALAKLPVTLAAFLFVAVMLVSRL
jgi:hypothetical protein